MSNYFYQFPLTTYELNGEKSVVKDIFRRAAFVSEYRPYSDLFSKYLIKDGDTPEQVAINFYGNVSYHWLILMFNEIHNVEYDWPMQQTTLEKYCEKKYTDPYVVSHYEINGVVVGEIKEYVYGEPWVPPENPYPSILACIPMTFFDKENTINDAKREIRILRTELMSDFMSQFAKAINGG